MDAIVNPNEEVQMKNLKPAQGSDQEKSPDRWFFIFSLFVIALYSLYWIFVGTWMRILVAAAVIFSSFRGLQTEKREMKLIWGVVIAALISVSVAMSVVISICMPVLKNALYWIVIVLGILLVLALMYSGDYGVTTESRDTRWFYAILFVFLALALGISLVVPF